MLSQILAETKRTMSLLLLLLRTTHFSRIRTRATNTMNSIHSNSLTITFIMPTLGRNNYLLNKVRLMGFMIIAQDMTLTVQDTTLAVHDMTLTVQQSNAPEMIQIDLVRRDQDYMIRTFLMSKGCGMIQILLRSMLGVEMNLMKDK